MSQYKRNNNELLKEQCLEYLGGKICVLCGNRSLPICCYDFHHKSGAKEENISKMIQRKTILDEELKKELDKCSVVDANCHRMITNRLIDNYKLRSLHPSMPRPEERAEGNSQAERRGTAAQAQGRGEAGQFISMTAFEMFL